MKTSHSERVYSWMAQIYPREFRNEFGEAMAQHFRDQLRDARQAGGAWALILFWTRMALDTFVASLRARMDGKQPKNRGGFMKAKVPSFQFLLVAFWLPLMMGVAVYLVQQPKEYLAIARIEIEKTGPNGTNAIAYDPYFLQTQFEVIKSGLVLEEVVRSFGLEKKLLEGEKERIGMAGAVELVRQRISVVQARNTSLIELRVKWFEAEAAAEMANRIIEAYREKTVQSARVEILDRAERSLRPVSPNVPLILTMGFLMSGAMAAAGAWGLRMAIRDRPGVASPA